MLGFHPERILLFLGALWLAPVGVLFAAQVQVQLEGLEGEKRKNALALLEINQRASDENLTEHLIRRLHSRAPEQIARSVQPFGFYRIQVDSELREPASDGKAWSARYRVELGDPVKIGAVDYRVTGPGEEDAVFPDEFGMRPGDVLIHSDYEESVRKLIDAASRNGYLDASLETHRVVVDPEANEAKVEVVLATGPKYYLGAVTFKQDLLDDDFLRRYIRFNRGDVYDPSKLLGLQASLLASEYYDTVDIVPHKEEAEGNVIPLDVVATPNKANKYRVGAGYATDTGPRIRLDWERRYVGRRGHRMHAELAVSPALSFLKGEYRIPLEKPTQDLLFIRPSIDSYDTSSREGTIAQVELGHSVILDNGWRRITGLNYRYEDYTDPVESRSLNELVPNISFSKTVTDDPILTRNGYRIQASAMGSVEGLISPSSYLGGRLFAKWIRSFGSDYRLITRADLGMTFAESLFDLPASRRFYAGGDSSIRGWGVDVLGPNDPDTNDTLGGRWLGVGSVELERKIYGDWGGAVFYDFGNAFDPDYKKEFKQGAGFGVRWRTPVGLVRVDIAFALSKPDMPARLHVVVGPDL